MTKLSFSQELVRKAVHYMMLLVVLGYLIFSKFIGHKTALFALVLLLIVMIGLEYIRINHRIKLPLFSWIWKTVRRDKEKKHIGSEIFFMLSTVICFAAFDERIALAAILMTTFGDPAACFIGRQFGRIWILKDRALEGIAAEFAVNVLVGFLFLRSVLWWSIPALPSGQIIWPAVFVMAFFATLVETFAGKIDDNLLIPLFAGAAGQAVLFMMSMA